MGAVDTKAPSEPVRLAGVGYEGLTVGELVAQLQAFGVARLVMSG